MAAGRRLAKYWTNADGRWRPTFAGWVAMTLVAIVALSGAILILRGAESWASRAVYGFVIVVAVCVPLVLTWYDAEHARPRFVVPFGAVVGVSLVMVAVLDRRLLLSAVCGFSLGIAAIGFRNLRDPSKAGENIRLRRLHGGDEVR